jgi:hypothetical protein
MRTDFVRHVAHALVRAASTLVSMPGQCVEMSLDAARKSAYATDDYVARVGHKYKVCATIDLSVRRHEDPLR